MSNSPPNSSIGDSQKPKRQDSRYRLYVWVITSSTIIVLALLAWPFTVKQFCSTAEIRLSFDPSAIERKTANATIAEAIAANTTDLRLTQLIDEIRTVPSAKSKLLNQDQLVELRQAIKVSTREGSSSNNVDLKISLTGRGSQDEILFVNRLSNLVANQLASGPIELSSRQYITQWSKQFALQLEEQNEFLFQVAGMIDEQLSVAIDQRNYIYQQLPNMDLTESAPNDEIESINLQHEMASLYQTMQRDQANNNYPANHPQMIMYQQQLEALKNRLNNIYQTGTAQRVKNQFISVAATANRKTSLDQVLEQLKIEELDTSYVIVEKMQRQMQANQLAQRQMLETIGNHLSSPINSSSAIRMDKITLATSSSPLGGAPAGNQMMTIAFLAFLLGGVMAWQYKPEMRIRRFQSAEHASNVLGVPAIGVLHENSQPVPGATYRWLVASLFKCFEYVLLCLALMLIIAMLVNSDIFGSVMENPFHAISKVIWMVTPR